MFLYLLVYNSSSKQAYRVDIQHDSHCDVLFWYLSTVRALGFIEGKMFKKVLKFKDF